MKTRIDIQETLRERAGAMPSGLGGEVAERVRAHVAEPLEQLRALLADGRAGELEPARLDFLLDTAQELVDRIDGIEHGLDGIGERGPGPRLTLALASELSFIARHLESPLPAPTVERLQPRVRRAARLATLWLSPHDFNATTTHGPSSAVSAAWQAQVVAPPASESEPAARPAAAPAGPAEAGPSLDESARDVVLARLDELRNERRRLEDRLEILDRYWRFATHELRNAAHSLVMIVEHLESATLVSAPWLEPLGRAARTVMVRSQEALDDSAVARGLFTVESEPIDLIEVALSALEEARPIAERHGVRLVGERLPVGQPLWAHADPGRVQQILHNLIRNAIAATPAGGFVMIETSAVDLQGCLVVSDSGPGIEPDRAEQLLSGAWSATATAERAGLGLPISRHLAEAMGGSVRPGQPMPGMGARFILSLPRIRS